MGRIVTPYSFKKAVGGWKQFNGVYNELRKGRTARPHQVQMRKVSSSNRRVDERPSIAKRADVAVSPVESPAYYPRGREFVNDQSIISREPMRRNIVFKNNLVSSWVTGYQFVIFPQNDRCRLPIVGRVRRKQAPVDCECHRIGAANQRWRRATRAGVFHFEPIMVNLPVG